MKKIIAGKRYDTTTADLVESWDNGRLPSDFHRCEETLFKTARVRPDWEPNLLSLGRVRHRLRLVLTSA